MNIGPGLRLTEGQENLNRIKALEKRVEKLEQSGSLDTTISVLPTDKETEEWFNNNIDEDSASSAIYKFRLWLKERKRELKG